MTDHAHFERYDRAIDKLQQAGFVTMLVVRPGGATLRWRRGDAKLKTSADGSLPAALDAVAERALHWLMVRGRGSGDSRVERDGDEGGTATT